MTRVHPRAAAWADAVVRVLRRRRRPLAALAAFLAVFWGLGAVRTPVPPTVTVLAAARDLPGGTTLAEADVVEVRLPAEVVPADAATTPTALVGRVLNGPVSARSVLTATDVAAGRELARPGHVVLAIPLGNRALASLLEPGARVDLFVAGEATALAVDARVVGVPEDQRAAWAAEPQPVVLVELPAPAAPRAAAAVSQGGLSVALH
nr:hypothetical protein [Propionibacterium sp.]